MTNPPNENASSSYLKAGVNVEAGDALVDWLQSEDNSNPNQIHKDKIISGIGGFASLFRLQFPEMKKPCLITCTDGVGTKVKLASQYGRFEEVAQDCVAMCVNDLICTGGKPLLFLDYYATGKLNLNSAQSFLKGLRKACQESLCALVGGETAEMPGVYQDNDFDVAGFAVGIVDEEKTLGAHKVKSGDRLLGVSSSGFHSNGYSLLRKVFEKDMDLWIETLIKPTELYVKLATEVFEAVDVHAAAHITGGGIENIPRVLPAELTWKSLDWEIPEMFLEVQRRTGLSREELKKTLNCGIGFVFVIPEQAWKVTNQIVEKHGFKVFDLGVLE